MPRLSESRESRTDHPRALPAVNMHLKLNYKVGDKLPLTVIRGGRRLVVAVELVE